MAAEQMGVDQSKLEASTSLADLGADELDLVELVMTLEEEFDQTISDAEIERMSGGTDLTKGFGKLTMADLAALVED
ncbi:phosphopantetheine-binding protein [Rhodopirellula bahusiensis]|uniref:phosphopantetheine-binding protein n=1 Tax=Rhodopirellula bahusiensis TaxID=2014065 RepID=UPI0021BC963C|nr:phosphopantetheine-binding protein [Rhodopirellula bahusiensis]